MSAAPPPPAPKKVRPRWRRWLWRLVVATVVARVLLAVFLPQLLGLVARSYGVTLTMRAATLSFTGLSLRLEDFEIRDPARPDALPLVSAHELEVDASFHDLLTGTLVLVDGALVSARIVVERDRNGQWLLPAACTSQAAVVTAPAAAPATAPAGPPSFALPLRIVSLRVHDVMLRLLDHAGVAPITHELTLDADVRDVGDERPGSAVVRLHAPDWFDTAWLRVQGSATPRRLALDWHLAVQDLRPAALPLSPEQHAQWADVRTCSGSLRGGLNGRLDAAGQHRVLDGSLRVALAVNGDDRAAWFATFGPTQTTGERTAVPFASELALPGLAHRIRIPSGQCSVAPEETTVRGTLSAELVTLARLAEPLRRAGITLPDGGLGITATWDAAIGATVNAELRDLALQGGGETVQMPLLQVRELHHDRGATTIAAIAATGPRLRLRKDADGAVQIAGVRLAPPPAAATPTPPATATAPAAAALPQLRIGSIAWQGAEIAVVDTGTTPATELVLRDVRVQGDGITLGADAPPGRLVVQARIDDCLEALQADVSLQPSAKQLQVQAALRADGITLASLAPWLAQRGITPTWRHGSLRAATGLRLAVADGELHADAELRQLELRDGDKALAELPLLRGTGLRVGQSGVDLGDWQLDGLRANLHRAADGRLQALGLWLAPTAPAPTATPPAVAPPATAAATAPVPVAFGELALRNTVLEFGTADDPTPAVVELTATVGRPGEGVREFHLGARIAGACERADVRGHFARDAGDGTAHGDAEVSVRGLRGDGLQRFLPPHLQCALVDGTFQLRAAAAWQTGLGVRVTDVALRDGGDELFALREFALRTGPLGGDVLQIDEVRADGLRGEFAATGQGLAVPGLLLRPQPATTAAPAATPATPLRLPLLAIDRLQFGIEHLVWRDRRGAGGEPLVLAGTLTMPKWVASADPEHPSPAQLSLALAAPPLCGHAAVTMQFDPFDRTPRLAAELHAQHLDFTALARIAPPLQSSLQGLLQNGELHARLSAQLDLRRKDVRTFDLARPFGGEITLEDVVLRDADTQQELGRLDALDAVARAIDPRRGDVLLRSLDIDGVRCDLARSAAGLELLGLRLPAAAATATTGPAAANGEAAPEFAIDRLQLQGVQCRFRDSTTDPVTLLPLADAELELTRFSTRGFTEARPFAFHAALRGGDVPLARRVLRSSLLAGVFGSAVDAIGGAADAHEMEPRPLLDELNVDGQLQLAPQLRGQVRANLTAFELAALRGLAKQGGIDIADGVLDQKLSVDLRGPDGIDITSSKVFTWLSLSEPPGGPISTYLRLPAPLDTVLFLLRNDADEHRLPTTVHVPASGLTSSHVFDAAAEATARIVADAVASAAARTAGALTGAIGLRGGPQQPVSVAIPFAAGDPLPAAHDLTTVVAAAIADPQVEIVLAHDLGAADLARAEALATPAPAAIADHVQQLRARRAAAAASRPALAAEVAALWAAGRAQDAQRRQAELAALGATLGELDRALDQALTMLANDSERARHRRTQAAAVAIGQSRLAGIVAELQRQLPAAAAARIVLRPARAAPAAGLTGAGQVVASTRRRASS